MPAENGPFPGARLEAQLRQHVEPLVVRRGPRGHGLRAPERRGAHRDPHLVGGLRQRRGQGRGRRHRRAPCPWPAAAGSPSGGVRADRQRRVLAERGRLTLRVVEADLHRRTTGRPRRWRRAPRRRACPSARSATRDTASTWIRTGFGGTPDARPVWSPTTTIAKDSRARAALIGEWNRRSSLDMDFPPWCVPRSGAQSTMPSAECHGKSWSVPPRTLGGPGWRAYVGRS